MVILAVVVLAAFTTPAVAVAQTDDAKVVATTKLVEAARLFDEGRFAQSLQLLEEACALFPSPKIAFNLGKTYRELGRDANALAALEQFLADANPADPSVAERRPEADEQARELRLKGVVATQAGRCVAPPPPPPPPSRPPDPPRPSEPVLTGTATSDIGTAQASLPAFYRRWWFWTGAAVVIAGVVTAAVWPAPERKPLCDPSCALGVHPVKLGAK